MTDAEYAQMLVDEALGILPDWDAIDARVCEPGPRLWHMRAEMDEHDRWWCVPVELAGSEAP